MSIPWHYFYSEPFFHNVLQGSLKGCKLNPTEFYFNRLEQRAGTVLDILKTSDAPFVIISDSEIIVKPGAIESISELEGDMIFLEGADGRPQTGIMRLKVSSDVIDFWSSLTSLEESLPEFNGSWGLFPNKFVSSQTWDNTSDFLVLHIIPMGLGIEFDFAEKLFIMAQHIEIQEYMHHVPENIIPFIYNIQELLFLSHKEMRDTQ
jgi:hypothetical protein